MKTPTTTSKGLRVAPPRPLQLLSRILEQPELVAMVRALPAPILGRLIDHVGLEDSGELIALASTEQLRQIFDADLWRSRKPGTDETFDARRFSVWLEVMLEAGEDFVAARLTELPEDLVTMALQQHLLVINLDELALSLLDEDGDVDMTEKALDSCLYEEFGEYQVISKRHDGWDALVSVLCALDQNHNDFLQRLLARCCAAASEYIADNGGLYEVLTSEEMLQVDVAAEREERRARQGFIAPSAAVSFLKLAEQTAVDEIVRSPRDPITHAYFRDLTTDSAGQANEDLVPAAKLLQLLKEADILDEEAAPRLLEHRGADADQVLRSAMVRLREVDASAFHQRLAELGYLANVLMAGHSVDGRSLRPAEAAEKAMTVCNRGLVHLLEQAASDVDDEHAPAMLRLNGADKLFRIGWRLQQPSRKSD